MYKWKRGDKNMAVLLIDRGAAVDKADKNGRTPLHAAVAVSDV